MALDQDVHVRLSAESLAALDKLRERLSLRGVAASRSTAVRLAITHTSELLKENRVHI
jgi:hypothetical protein